MDKNWFTRFKQDHVDPLYVKNMKDATNYFSSWFTGRHQARYVDMLTSMHKLATRGGYSGFTNSDGPVVPVGSEFRGVNKEAWRPLLKKKWFNEVEVIGGKIWPTLREQRLRGCHHLIDRKNGYELHLPHEDRVPDFLARMEKVMGLLRHDFDPVWLAEYIQLFVVGHPFERVNYSICMAQVNLILYRYGFEPIRHGYFDFECFIHDFGCIERKFNNLLRRQ